MCRERASEDQQENDLIEKLAKSTNVHRWGSIKLLDIWKDAQTHNKKAD